MQLRKAEQAVLEEKKRAAEEEARRKDLEGLTARALKDAETARMKDAQQTQKLMSESQRRQDLEKKIQAFQKVRKRPFEEMWNIAIPAVGFGFGLW